MSTRTRTLTVEEMVHAALSKYPRTSETTRFSTFYAPRLMGNIKNMRYVAIQFPISRSRRYGPVPVPINQFAVIGLREVSIDENGTYVLEHISVDLSRSCASALGLWGSVNSPITQIIEQNTIKDMEQEVATLLHRVLEGEEE